MCYFITIAVPTASVDAVCAAHRGPGMSIERTANPSAIETAGVGRVPLLVTGGGCSCAWYTRPAGDRTDERIARAEARYRREGWSEAKIERALASMRSAARQADQSSSGLHGVILDLLDAVVREHRRAALWIHDFTGQVESEHYAMRRRERWGLDELRLRGRAAELDVLAEIGME